MTKKKKESSSKKHAGIMKNKKNSKKSIVNDERLLDEERQQEECTMTISMNSPSSFASYSPTVTGSTIFYTLGILLVFINLIENCTTIKIWDNFIGLDEIYYKHMNITQKYYNRMSVMSSTEDTNDDDDDDDDTMKNIMITSSSIPSIWKQKKYPTASKSLIHDKTLYWDPKVQRPWLQQQQQRGMINSSSATTTTTRYNNDKPSVQILLTNIGWNQKNQTIALQKHPRGLRQTWLIEGVINHPYFHPTGWEDIESGRVDIDPNIHYYVFLDKYTCMDHHWPVYGGQEYQLMDSKHNRTISSDGDKSCWYMQSCDVLPNYIFSKTRLFQFNQKYNNVRMINIDCLAWNHIARTNKTMKWPISSIIMENIGIHKININHDMGLPPPATKKVILSKKQIHSIYNCKAEKSSHRPWFLTYWGNTRAGPGTLNGFHTRHAFLKFHNETEKRLVMTHEQIQKHPLFHSDNYTKILSETIFAPTPRGDCKYSYRFTEALSAGAIPIFLGDNWIWPFRAELFKWEDCAIILPERDVDNVLSIIYNMTIEERCQRRKTCYTIYKKYMETGVGTITGIIDSLEKVAELDAKGLPHANFSGYHCTADKNNSRWCNEQ